MTGTDLTLEQRRGHAREALFNPVIQETLKALEDEAVSGWKAAQTTEQRERFWDQFQAAKKVRIRIESELSKLEQALNPENDEQEDSL